MMKIPNNAKTVTMTISKQKNMAFVPASFMICYYDFPACLFSSIYWSISFFSYSLRLLNIFSFISFFFYSFLAINSGSFNFFYCSSIAFFINAFCYSSLFFLYYLFCLIACGSFCMNTSKLIAETTPITTPSIILL